MSHTCPQCGYPRRLVVAPTVGGFERMVNKSKRCRRLNRNYRHVGKNWKRTRRFQWR